MAVVKLPMVVIGGIIESSSVEISGEFAKGPRWTIAVQKTGACGGWVVA